MCLQTFQRFASDSLKRCSWTPAEDALLQELVEKMRIGNFIPYTQSRDTHTHSCLLQPSPASPSILLLLCVQ